MPTYDYYCRMCFSRWEFQTPIADRDEPTTKECPECHLVAVERVSAAPGVCYGIHDHKKVPNAFKDVLKKIKASHHGSTIQT